MQMEFTLKNTHVTGSEVKDFLTDKTGKIERFFDGKLRARWTISYENEEHVAHLHVTGNNLDQFGEARSHNLYSSIEETVGKLERQLQRHKEIVQEKHKT
jgi:putative sigma-54 modulation protein